MKKTQQNKLNMYEAVSAVLQKHADSISGIVQLATAKADILALLETIKAKGRSRVEATAGITANKSHARHALVVAALSCASSLYSFGLRTKNSEVSALADLKVGRLSRVRDNELVARSTSLHEWATAHAAEIESYGLTKATLDDLHAKIVAFSAALGEREAGFAERVSATETLEKLFGGMDALLKDEMDRLAQLARWAAPDFYGEYFAARVIKDLGGKREKPTVAQPVAPVVVLPTSPTTSATAQPVA